MDRELIDRAWRVLPAEFREEVKKVARIYSGRTSALFGAERYLANKFLDEFIGLFGHHNLTSDAEGEEMLAISRREIQQLVAANDKLIKKHPGRDSIEAIQAKTVNTILNRLFGSKCLPDELANEDNFATKEPKYRVGQRMYIKYINKIGTIDVVQGYNEEEDGIYYHLKVEPKGVCTAREENLQPYNEPKPAKPKFKRCKKVITPSGEVRIIEDTHFENGSWLYLVGDPAQWIPESDLEPYTEPKAGFLHADGEVKTSAPTFTDECKSQCKSQGFDTLLKDSFSKEHRLNIAAMMAQAILTRIDDTPQVIAEAAFRHADALIAEAEKGDTK